MSCWQTATENNKSIQKLWGNSLLCCQTLPPHPPNTQKHIHLLKWFQHDTLNLQSKSMSFNILASQANLFSQEHFLKNNILWGVRAPTCLQNKWFNHSSSILTKEMQAYHIKQEHMKRLQCVRIPDTFRYAIMGCPFIFIPRLALRLFVLKSYNH